jgi:hypothetical protein
MKSQFATTLSYYREFSSDFPQITQINADINSRVQFVISVICVICGQKWVGENPKSEPAGDGATRRPEADSKSEFRNLGAGGQTTVLT